MISQLAVFGHEGALNFTEHQLLPDVPHKFSNLILIITRKDLKVTITFIDKEMGSERKSNIALHMGRQI